VPLTPFHLGPGALFKAAARRRFSFMVFGGSQVLMDIEPLVKMIRGDAVIHGPSHTILGALFIGLVSGLIGRPISELVLRRLRFEHYSITWPVSFVSAFVGIFSHVVLDAIMHKDMNPLWPLTSGNPMLGLISISSWYASCVIAGILGVGILVVKRE
jgi:LexA-binding, inner membrane-associated putative hydrolase